MLNGHTFVDKFSYEYNDRNHPTSKPLNKRIGKDEAL